MIRLTRVQVETYRGLKDLDLTFDAPGGGSITVLLGPNEAGKSTLLDFTREVLFGNGAVRGSVTLEASGRRYRVTALGRRVRQVTDLTTGEVCPPATARELLGAIDEQVFRNVFAFGLSELQTLSSLTAQGIQERIFSAGVAGAGPSARAALGQLDREASEYLRPRALSRLTGGADAYAKLRTLVRATQQDAAEYAPKVAELARIRQSTHDETEALAQLTTRQANLEHLQRLWPQWVARLEAEARLNELDDVPAGVEATQEAVRTLAQDVRELEGQLAALEGELAALPEARPELVAAGLALDTLLAELAAHRERERHAEALEAAQHRTAAALNEQRVQLPEGVQSASLGAADVTQLLPLVEEHDRALSSALARQETLLREVEAATREMTLRQAELEALPAPGALEAAPVTADERAAREEVQEAHDRLAEAEREHQALAPDSALLPHLPTLQQAVDQAPITVLAALAPQRSALEQQREVLRQKLAELGPDWDEARLAALSPTAEHAWREKGQGHARAWADTQRGEEEAQRALQARNAACHEAELRLSSLPSGPSASDLATQVQGLREQLTLAHAVRARLQVAAVPDAVPLSPPPWKLWLSLALTALLTVAAFMAHPALALMTLVAGLALSLLQKPATPAAAPTPPTAPTADVTADLTRLQLPAKAGLGEVAALESRLTLQLGDLERQRTDANQRDDAARALHTARTLEQEAQAALDGARQASREAQAHFATWAAEHRLPLTRPADLDAFLLRLASARDVATQVEATQAEALALERQQAAFVWAAQQTLGAIGRTTTAEAALGDLRRALTDALETSRLAQRQEDAARLVVSRTEERRRAHARLTQLRQVQAHRHAEAAQRVGEQEKGLSALSAQHSEASQGLEEARRDWEALLEGRGLPPSSPATARVMLEQLRRVADMAQTLQEQELELSQLRQQVTTYVQQVRQTLTPLGGGTDMAALQQSVALAREAAGQAGQRRALEVQLAGVREKWNRAAAALSETLSASGAPDVATLNHWVAVNQERADLQDVIRQADREVHLIAGQEEARFRRELDAAQPGAWGEERERLTADRERLQKTLQEAHGQAAQLQLELRHLDESEHTVMIQLRLEAQRQQLRLDARAWIVRRLATVLLETTLKEYERTKGPEVLRHASEVFGQITGGRYVAVRQLDGNATFRAISDRDDVIDVEQLSRGTQEQLYLAIRLGLARTLGQRTARLPLMMDDVLVNADPGRARAVAAALAEVARDHQILYLTCHPANAQILQETQDNVRIIELPRLGRHATSPAGGEDQTVLGAADPGLDVREYMAAHQEPVLMADLRSALPHLSDEDIRRQLTLLERNQSLIKTGQRKGTRYALA
ncbi:uncharacterized protein YhaN [Deinococcus budaensis]|uniref:Uncharacterized protein YhaN n=1 Tax=Deinococcus budaensis TaxID=1665626 RepID=A0A7W8GH83_9DEIO|nr:AAA family ATPase [Deinococcus budaensis]MBB5235577.1 uncharacterized protein YhaN [Deinococcus budaensis]